MCQWWKTTWFTIESQIVKADSGGKTALLTFIVFLPCVLHAGWLLCFCGMRDSTHMLRFLYQCVYALVTVNNKRLLICLTCVLWLLWLLAHTFVYFSVCMLVNGPISRRKVWTGWLLCLYLSSCKPQQFSVKIYNHNVQICNVDIWHLIEWVQKIAVSNC